MGAGVVSGLRSAVEHDLVLTDLQAVTGFGFMQYLMIDRLMTTPTSQTQLIDTASVVTRFHCHTSIYLLGLQIPVLSSYIQISACTLTQSLTISLAFTKLVFTTDLS